MRKITFIAIALLLPSYTFAQFTKVEKENLIGKVQHFKITESNNNYIITYNDLKFTKITDFKSFILNKEEFTQLFEIIQKGLSEIPKENIEIENDTFMLSIKFVKMMGVRSVQIIHLNKKTEVAGLTRYLTKKQVLKVFGKKK